MSRRLLAAVAVGSASTAAVVATTAFVRRRGEQIFDAVFNVGNTAEMRIGKADVPIRAFHTTSLRGQVIRHDAESLPFEIEPWSPMLVARWVVNAFTSRRFTTSGSQSLYQVTLTDNTLLPDPDAPPPEPITLVPGARPPWWPSSPYGA